MDMLLLRQRESERGFALVFTMVLLVLISALAIALLFRTNTEQNLQRTDSGNNLAYYGAEAGMEKMTADLNGLYSQQAAPDWCDITALENNQPTFSDAGVTYPEYLITVPSPPSGCGLPTSTNRTISQGTNAGLMAQIVPLTLQVTANRPSGEQVRILRSVEVAEIPVFQFAAFSQGDMSFFPGPDFDFNGRVQTNGNLFLAADSSVTFHTSIRAAGDVVRDQLANGASTSAQGRNGNVNIPTTTAGCDGTKPACRNMGPDTANSTNEGSSIGGPSSTYGGSGTANSNWTTISTTTYHSMILSGSTGAKALNMAFVQPGVTPIEIIRRPLPGESTSSAVGESRLYNQAQIRVLLSDDPAELPGGASDANNIRLANVQTNSSAPDYSKGVPAAVPSSYGALSSGKPYMTYFAEASTATQDPSGWTNSTSQTCLTSDWTNVPSTPASTSSLFTLMNYETKPTNVTNVQAAVFTSPSAGYAPYISAGNPLTPNPTCFRTATQGAALVPPLSANVPSPPTQWNLIDGYLRVEVRKSDGTYLPVTKEWLELGFARGLTPPTSTTANPVHPKAILLFQEPADRDGDGALDTVGATGAQTTSTTTTCNSHGRNCVTTTTVTAAGIAEPPEVQTDAHSNTYYYGDGNDSTSVTRNNWYPINFYDAREGELRENQRTTTTCNVGGIMNAVEIDVHNLQKWLNGTIGTSGRQTEADSQNGYVLYFSDRRGMLPNTNAGSIKNGEYGFEDVINPSTAAGTPNNQLDTGEDSDGNGVLDTWGAGNLGFGFGSGNTGSVTRAITCMTLARKNWISGARHVVRLVDGSVGNLPVRWDSSPVGGGGFTLASENPAYILGDYNASVAAQFTGAHASAAVVADFVTLLSNSWTDLESLNSPADVGGRSGATTYYRVAVASGKNLNFPLPTWSGSPSVPEDYGTDGGIHNFLPYLEDWGSSTANYLGSMVNLYYANYATGIYKCCGTVYNPPTRNYAFDTDFQDLNKMPPGTPRFRDVVNLGSQQMF